MNKIKWKLRRGMRELDLLLTDYFEHRWNKLPGTGQQAFRELLECEDDLLWDWLTGRASPPDDRFIAIIDDIRQHADR